LSLSTLSREACSNLLCTLRRQRLASHRYFTYNLQQFLFDNICTYGRDDPDATGRMTKDQLKQLEADLWSAADNLRANSDLKSSEYSTPVLGLIFLKFADNNYRRYEVEILAEYQKLKGTRREKKISEIAIEKCGFYLPDHARYDYLLNLPEKQVIARELKE